MSRSRSAGREKDGVPVTPAVRALRAAGIPFEAARYDYAERGGTARAASELGLDGHAVVKTLVFEDDARRPLIVLMHGDREVSAKELARALGVKSVEPCRPEVAARHTGYQVGGTSPLGMRKDLPIHVERSILELGRIWINGGKRGFLVALDPSDLAAALELRPVEVARDP